ncbi:MAG: hypothetical protein GY772_02615 [bacterium]|nr:hypothetical protein [bacterium]
MPLSKYPIEIPLGGAVDEGNVPEIVQPPRILEALNCHSVTGGAYEKKDDDVAVSAPPGKPFVVSTTDEAPLVVGDREAHGWSGAQWEQKFPPGTIAGEVGAFYPTDGGELNLSPDVAISPPEAATNGEERLLCAWYADDPSTDDRCAYRVFTGSERRPLSSERRLPTAGATSVQGAVWARAVSPPVGDARFVIVVGGGAQYRLFVLDADGVVLLSTPAPSVSGYVVDVQARGLYVYLLVHGSVNGLLYPGAQPTDVDILRYDVGALALLGLLPPGTVYQADQEAPCGLYLLGPAITAVFSSGDCWTVPLLGGAPIVVSNVIEPVGQVISTGPTVPFPLPFAAYLPPAQVRPQSFCSYDAGSEQAWIGINTQAFQQTPIWAGEESNFIGPPDPLASQMAGAPLGSEDFDEPYDYPSWANGLYGCAYVEHVLVDIDALAGVPSAVAGSQGVLQGAAVAGGGIHDEAVGHTAMLSTPSPANILTNTLARTGAFTFEEATGQAVGAREDWVQPTVCWCTRTVVPEYDRHTPLPAVAPANLAARNQALSICMALPNEGTLYPVRAITRSVLPVVGSVPDAEAHTGLQNDVGTGPRPSAVRSSFGIVLGSLQWTAARAPVSAPSAPVSGFTPPRASQETTGELAGARPKVFEFRPGTSLDARPSGPSACLAGPQPVIMGRSQPLAAGNPLQCPIITYGFPGIYNTVPGTTTTSTSGGVPIVSGTVRPQAVQDVVSEGNDWPPTGPDTGPIYVGVARLRTTLSIVDSDDLEHRSLPWLPPPAAPFPWFGQILYKPANPPVGPGFPQNAVIRSVACVASPVTWQLAGVPSDVRSELELYACGEEGEPARSAVFPLPLVVDWTGGNAGVWRLGGFNTSGLLPTDDALPVVLGDGASLYTEAGELAADAPPPLRALTATGGRLFGIDSTDPRQVFYTKQVREGYAPEWNRNLSFRVNDSAEELTALGALPDGRLLLFSANTSYYTYGDGPSDTGQGAGFAEPALLSRDVGCRDWRSVAEGTFGVMFRGERGVHLVDRQLSMQFVGLPYELTTEREILVTATAVDAYRSEVSFFIDTPGPFGEQCWTYNYLRNQWSSYTGAQVISATEQGANVALLTSDPPRTYAVRERSASTGEALMSLRVGWLAMGKIQGYGRTWEVQLTGIRDAASFSGLRVEIYYDYIDTASETYTFDAVGSGQFKVRFRPRRQKSEAISFRFSEYVPVGVPASVCTGWRLDMCTVLAGVKAGLDKVAVTARST